MKLAKSLDDWNSAQPVKSFKYKDSLIGQKIQGVKAFGDVTQLILDIDVIAAHIGTLKNAGLPFELECGTYDITCVNPIKFEKVGFRSYNEHSVGASSTTNILKFLDRTKFNMIEMGYFIAYYHKAVDGEQDLISRILLCFKDDEEPETSEWISMVILAFPSNYKPDIILRTLRSSETSASSSSSLDRLGRAIAQKIGSRYEPSYLSKIRTTRPFHFMKTKQERFDEIHGVYRYNGQRVKNILLIDDIITTSTTITEIKRSIIASIGEVNLRVFVLGKTFDSWIDGMGDNSEIESCFSNATAY
jgi:hypothetical protein